MTGGAPVSSRSEVRYGEGAALWAFAFAGISFYWAAGGTFGAITIGTQIESYVASVPGFVIVLWVDAVLKSLLGVLALALIFPSWGRELPGRPYLPPIAWGAGLAMAAYGTVELSVTGVSALLMATGVLASSPKVDWVGIVGHLALWDPYWLLGGFLFLFAAKTAGARIRGQIIRWIRSASHLR